MPKYTADKVIQQVRAHHGNIAAVARAFNTSRNQMYRFMERHPSVKQVVEEAREVMLDNAESALYRNVLAGDNTALIFFLKTQGRRRGYVEWQEHIAMQERIERDSRERELHGQLDAIHRHILTTGNQYATDSVPEAGVDDSERDRSD